MNRTYVSFRIRGWENPYKNPQSDLRSADEGGCAGCESTPDTPGFPPAMTTAGAKKNVVFSTGCTVKKLRSPTASRGSTDFQHRRKNNGRLRVGH
ncbi:hypothetical protein ZHAS_00012309 [Anopheles sinensis]|uniref:Uncharacterized protein n=1 Tax=Anopheles sinensis TaxID=74873 RepID=A0A084W2C4_ANOSI|nr:hypothetical protein ZHAS_00012309 [Anopheles sinensis]